MIIIVSEDTIQQLNLWIETKISIMIQINNTFSKFLFTIYLRKELKFLVKRAYTKYVILELGND